jgi:hypothetical protein
MKSKLIILVGAVFVLSVLAVPAVWFTCRISVPPGSCAVLVRKMGSALPAGQLVAIEPGQKGIELDVLGPGRHFRDPYRYEWELKSLTVVPAGNPTTWEWIHTIGSKARERIRDGNFQPKGDFPMIGVVTRRIGKPPPAGQVLVKRDSEYAGILEEVLTPGTYKLNPYRRRGDQPLRQSTAGARQRHPSGIGQRRQELDLQAGREPAGKLRAPPGEAR